MSRQDRASTRPDLEQKQTKEEHAGLGRKLEARGSATENRSSQTVTARDMFLELGMVSQPYDSSTQEDQMFKASLGFEKRERNKRKGCGGDWFLFCICSPSPLIFPFPQVRASHSFGVWFVYYGVLPSISLPMSGCHSFMTGSHVQDFPRACSRD